HGYRLRGQLLELLPGPGFKGARALADREGPLRQRGTRSRSRGQHGKPIGHVLPWWHPIRGAVRNGVAPPEPVRYRTHRQSFLPVSHQALMPPQWPDTAYRLRNSRIAAAISATWVSSAKCPVGTKRTSASGM